MNLSLYQIEQEYINIANQLMDGEVTPELETALQINKEELQNKAVNYGFVVKQLKSECDIIDAEISRLTDLKKRRNKAVDKLKDNLSQAMLLYMVEKIETPIMKISFLKSKSVEIDDMELIPKEYTTSKTTVSLDKRFIKSDLENGIDIPGARIQTNQNIQIK